jgi:hypothetical protein
VNFLPPKGGRLANPAAAGRGTPGATVRLGVGDRASKHDAAWEQILDELYV